MALSALLGFGSVPLRNLPFGQGASSLCQKGSSGFSSFWPQMPLSGCTSPFLPTSSVACSTQVSSPGPSVSGLQGETPVGQTEVWA